MKKILMASLMALAMFGVTGCSKDEIKDKLCDAGKTAAVVVSSQVASQLSCSNPAAIQADIEQKLIDLKVCSAPSSQGLLGAAICPPVVDGLVSGLLTQIPASWGCSGGELSDSLRQKLVDACSAAF